MLLFGFVRCRRFRRCILGDGRLNRRCIGVGFAIGLCFGDLCLYGLCICFGDRRFFGFFLIFVVIVRAGFGDFVAAGEMAALKAEQARLAGEVAELRAIVARIAGELGIDPT